MIRNRYQDAMLELTSLFGCNIDIQVIVKGDENKINDIQQKILELMPRPHPTLLSGINVNEIYKFQFPMGLILTLEKNGK